MKNNLILVLCGVFLLAISVYFYVTNKEETKLTIATTPLYISALKESLINQKINLDEACKNPNTVKEIKTDLTKADFKDRLTYLCEDQKMTAELESNFSTSTNYEYFLTCAKDYATEIQQVMKDLKEHYPEDYKNLNFKQEDVLLKYLKHPSASYLRVKCEAKAESLYWKSITESDKVEDLAFCVSTTEDCLSGKTKEEECPVDFKKHYAKCTKKLSKIKHTRPSSSGH